jgi:hypothetical protein
MLCGDDFAGKHCARCSDLLTLPIVYRDSLWFHQSCWQEGVEQLSNATRLAASSLPAATDYHFSLNSRMTSSGERWGDGLHHGHKVHFTHGHSE